MYFQFTSCVCGETFAKFNKKRCFVNTERMLKSKEINRPKCNKWLWQDKDKSTYRSGLLHDRPKISEGGNSTKRSENKIISYPISKRIFHRKKTSLWSIMGKNYLLQWKSKSWKVYDVANNIDFTSEPYGGIKIVSEDDNYSTNTDDDGKITQD